MLEKMIIALILTCVIEGLLAILLTQKAKVVGILTVANLLTNPCANLILRDLRKYYAIELLGEGIIVVVEGFLLYYFTDLKKSKAFLLSLCVNLASYLTGIIISL